MYTAFIKGNSTVSLCVIQSQLPLNHAGQLTFHDQMKIQWSRLCALLTLHLHNSASLCALILLDCTANYSDFSYHQAKSASDIDLAWWAHSAKIFQWCRICPQLGLTIYFDPLANLDSLPVANRFEVEPTSVCTTWDKSEIQYLVAYIVIPCLVLEKKKIVNVGDAHLEFYPFQIEIIVLGLHNL